MGLLKGCHYLTFIISSNTVPLCVLKRKKGAIELCFMVTYLKSCIRLLFFQLRVLSWEYFVFYCKSALVRVLPSPQQRGDVSYFFSLSLGLSVPSLKDAGTSLPSSEGGEGKEATSFLFGKC